MNQPDLFTQTKSYLEEDNIRILDRFCSLMKWEENEIILDVGIGDGENTVKNLIARIPGSFKQVIGFEVAEIMLKHAKQTAEHPKVEFVLFDVCSKTIPSYYENGFGHIFSFFCMELIYDQSQAFKNMFKMLKPGGQMLLVFAVKLPFADAFEILSKNNRWTKYIHKEPPFKYHGTEEPAKELTKDLEEIGFTVTSCHVEHKVWEYSTLAGFRDNALCCNPDLSKIPPEDKEDFINDYMDAMFQHKEWASIKNGPNGRKSYYLTFDLFVVFASKPINLLQ